MALHSYPSILPFTPSTTVSLSPQGDMTRARGVVSVGHQAERKDAMQQVIVSRNDKEKSGSQPLQGTFSRVFLQGVR